MVNIFSASVFGATLPKPTDVNDVKVKYSAVTYLDWKMVIHNDHKREKSSIYKSIKQLSLFTRIDGPPVLLA